MASVFDEHVERRGTRCAKWDSFDRIYQIPDLIHVGCADMDFRAPAPLLKRLHELCDHGVFGYSDIFDDFYEAIQRFYKDHHHCEIPQEQIVFCPRINIACGLCAEAFTRPYDEVLIHTPSYPPLRQAIEENGRHLVQVPLQYENGVYSLTKEALEQAVSPRTRMLILVNPHNPTTRVFTKEELTVVADFCVEHDLILFADEIHGDLLPVGANFVSVLELDAKYQDHIIMASSPAKTFNMPGLVGSFMVISNPKLRARVRDEISRIGEHNPNAFFNAALVSAYTECDEYLAELRAYLDQNEQYIREGFAQLFPQCHVCKREGSYLLWIDMQARFTSAEEMRHFFFDEAHVAVYLGEQFGAGCERFVRFNLAAPRATLEEVMKRLTNVKAGRPHNAE